MFTVFLFLVLAYRALAQAGCNNVQIASPFGSVIYPGAAVTISVQGTGSCAGTAYVNSQSYQVEEIGRDTPYGRVSITIPTRNYGAGAFNIDWVPTNTAYARKSMAITLVNDCSPVITSPYAGEPRVDSTSPVTVTGTMSKYCSNALLTLDGVDGAIVEQPTSGAFSLSYARPTDTPYKAVTAVVRGIIPGWVISYSQGVTFYTGSRCADPIVSTPASVISGSSVTFTGSAGNIFCQSFLISLSRNGSPVTSRAVDTTGSWSTTFDGLDNGMYTATIQTLQSSVDIPNSAHRSVSRSFRINGAKCSAPVILTPTEGSTRAPSSSFTFTGTADPRCGNIQLVSGFGGSYTTTAGSSGSWTIVVKDNFFSELQPSNPAASKEWAVEVRSSSADYDEVRSLTRKFNIVGPCGTPAITVPARGSTVRASSAFVISGTADPRCPSIQVVTQSGGSWTTTVSSSGTWSITDTSNWFIPRPDGPWIAEVRSTGSRTGLETVASNTMFTVIQQACSAPVITYPAEGQNVVRSDAFRITGTSDPRCPSIQVVSDKVGGDFRTTAVNGRWEVVVTNGHFYPREGSLMEARSSGSAAGLEQVSSGTRTFNVLCTTPIISTPPEESTLYVGQVRSILFSGTVDTWCPTVRIVVLNSGSSWSQTFGAGATGAWSYTASDFFTARQGWQVQVESTGNGRKVVSSTRTFNVVDPCPAPTIDIVRGTTYFSQTITLTGSTSTACPVVSFYQDSSNSVLATVTASGGRFQLTRTFSEGANLIMAAAGSSGTGPVGSVRSVAQTFTVSTIGCAPPTVLLPSPDIPVQVLRPTISGTDTNGGMPQCPSLSLDINGRTYTIPYDATLRKRGTLRTWSYTLPADGQLPPGTYTYTVYPNRYSSGNSVQPGPVTRDQGTTRQMRVVLAPTGGTTTPGGRKRSRMCRRDEDVCVRRTSKGFMIQECVPDLSSNLERCGSCDGPDCSAMQNVDVVDCIAGSCIISSCLEGYDLTNNSCLLAGAGRTWTLSGNI